MINIICNDFFMILVIYSSIAITMDNRDLDRTNESKVEVNLVIK